MYQYPNVNNTNCINNYYNGCTFNINPPRHQKPQYQKKYCYTEAEDDKEEEEKIQKSNFNIRMERHNGSNIYHIKYTPGHRTINIKI